MFTLPFYFPFFSNPNATLTSESKINSYNNFSPPIHTQSKMEIYVPYQNVAPFQQVIDEEESVNQALNKKREEAVEAILLYLQKIKKILRNQRNPLNREEGVTIMNEVEYKRSEINAELGDIFRLALHDLRKKYEKQFDHYEIEKAWEGSIVVGQTFYMFHVKEGHIPNHHHYTVHFQINHGKFIFGWVEEGLKSVL